MVFAFQPKARSRIIDSEDPRSALGNIKPRQIMDISDAVLNYKRDLEVQVATSIGEDQLLFRRSETGQAIEKSPYEKAGKASQAALGIANSMGVNVHPSPLVKVSGWLTIDGNSIGMTGGIRPRSYVDWTGTALPAYVILVTAHIAGDYANPWDDIIDDRADVIRYWGDAKHS